MEKFDFIEVETEEGYRQVSASFDKKNNQIILGDSKIQVSQHDLQQLLAEKDKENERIQEQLRLEKRKQTLDKTMAYRELIEKRIKFFSDEFELELHKCSFVIAAAPSGHGKSTFAKQSAAHAINANRRVLIISNELPAEAYYLSITQKLQGMANLDFNTAFNKVYTMCHIEDMYTSKGMTQGWMTCVQYMFNMIKKHEPDLVFLDQLSNANLDIGYTGKEKIPDFKKFELMAAEIQNRIHAGDKNWPPIITFQQMMPPSDTNTTKWSMKNLLRDSKNTMNYATHCLMILKKQLKEGGYATLIAIDKVRYEYTFGPALTTWKMDTDWVLYREYDSNG